MAVVSKLSLHFFRRTLIFIRFYYVKHLPMCVFNVDVNVVNGKKCSIDLDFVVLAACIYLKLLICIYDK